MEHPAFFSFIGKCTVIRKVVPINSYKEKPILKSNYLFRNIFISESEGEKTSS